MPNRASSKLKKSTHPARAKKTTAAPAKSIRKTNLPRKKGPGPTRAMALRSMQRFGDPNERMKARLKLEAKRSDLTLLDPNEKLLRVNEAAARIGVSPSTLRAWALYKEKVLYRRLGGWMLMIPESEVERLRNEYGN